MMTVGSGSDWKTILGAVAERAGAQAELDADFSSGFDGGAFIWSWRRPSEERVEEVSLRAVPDTLRAGVQTELLALARQMHPPFLTWSAATWTSHLNARAFSDAHHDELERFKTELPLRLTEAFAKTHSVVDHLEELNKEKEQSRLQAFNKVRDLITDDSDGQYRRWFH